MSLIHKSNVVASVAAFRDSDVVTSTAAELYSVYEDRVIADGGSVTDPVATLDAITKAIAGDYYTKTLLAVSPSFGVKLSGSNIVKFYDLVGKNDIVPDAAVALDDTTYDHPISTGEFNSPVLPICQEGWGFTQSVVSVHGASLLQHRTRRSDNDEPISAILFDFPAPARVFNANGDITATPNFLGPDAYTPQTLFIDEISSLRFSLLRSAVNISQQVVGGALYDYINNDAYIEFTDFIEVWHLDRGTLELSGTVSLDQRQRYPAP